MKITGKLLPLLFLAMPASLMAQREAKVEETYTFAVSEDDNITMFQAKQRAIELAKNEAVKREFGTLLDDVTITETSENDGRQTVSTVTGSTTARAKGVWLADRKPTEVTVEARDGKIFFTAHVWGIAREIVHSAVRLDWITMRRGANGLESSTVFNQREPFFIDFKAPVDGYLAVYLVYQEDGVRMVQCMLPYMSEKQGRHFVKGGESNILFDRSSDSRAVPLMLSTKYGEESFRFVLVWSPNPFTKCIDTKNGGQLPTVTYDYFQKWLLGIQRNDPDMVVDSDRRVKVRNPAAVQE